MARLSDWTATVEATPPPTQDVVVEGEIVKIIDNPEVDPLNDLLAQLGTQIGTTNYASDDLEEDLTVAVELLFETGIYLKILRDLTRRFSVLSPAQEKDFKEHVEKIEEFTGQWD